MVSADGHYHRQSRPRTTMASPPCSRPHLRAILRSLDACREQHARTSKPRHFSELACNRRHKHPMIIPYFPVNLFRICLIFLLFPFSCTTLRIVRHEQSPVSVTAHVLISWRRVGIRTNLVVPFGGPLHAMSRVQPPANAYVLARQPAAWQRPHDIVSTTSRARYRRRIH